MDDIIKWKFFIKQLEKEIMDQCSIPNRYLPKEPDHIQGTHIDCICFDEIE